MPSTPLVRPLIVLSRPVVGGMLNFCTCPDAVTLTNKSVQDACWLLLLRGGAAREVGHRSSERSNPRLARQTMMAAKREEGVGGKSSQEEEDEERERGKAQMWVSVGEGKCLMHAPRWGSVAYMSLLCKHLPPALQLTLQIPGVSKSRAGSREIITTPQLIR
jgi:hypothetical protein